MHAFDGSQAARDLGGAIEGIRSGDLNRDDIGADARLHLGGRAPRNDPPLVDDGEVVGEAIGFLEILGREEDGDALLDAEPVHVAPDGLAADGVEAGRRFIQEEDAGSVDEGRGEIEAALHAAGIRADGAIGGVFEVDNGEQFVDALAAYNAAHAKETRLKREQFPAGLHVVETRLLESHADAVPHGACVGEDVEAVDACVAGGGTQQRGEHTNGGRLAGAVLPEETEDRSRRDVEVDAIDGAHLIEVLDQTLGPDGAHRFERRGPRALGKLPPLGPPAAGRL